eukprot:6490717-Amphidinium_carterae.1
MVAWAVSCCTLWSPSLVRSSALPSSVQSLTVWASKPSRTAVMMSACAGPLTRPQGGAEFLFSEELPPQHLPEGREQLLMVHCRRVSCRIVYHPVEFSLCARWERGLGPQLLLS